MPNVKIRWSENAPTARMKTPTVPPARNRGAARRLEIIQAARELFTERGYALTSTDAILERCGGSKETIYSHFGSKLGLFRAAVLRDIESAVAKPAEAGTDDPIELLRYVGHKYVFGVTAESMRFARVVLSEMERLHDIAPKLWEIGQIDFADGLSLELRRLQSLGTFPQADTETVARVFCDMLSAGTLLRRLFDPQYAPTKAELDAHVELCIDVALRLARP